MKALLEVEVRVSLSLSLCSSSSCSSLYWNPSIFVGCGVVNMHKLLAGTQTRVPIQQQQLLFNGREMRNAEKLSSNGVKDEDLLMMVSAAASRYVITCM